MAEFRMPSLGADMEAGTLVEWLKRPGDRVARGDVIAVVETAKGAIEIEVFENGVIEALIAEPGTTLPVGAAMATIRRDEAAAAPALAGIAAAAPLPAAVQTTTAPPAHVPSRAASRTMISPAARKRAAELGIDPGAIAGHGPAGAITLADVEHAAAAPPTAPSQTMRQVIGAAMARSKQEIPHYYLSTDVDFEWSLRWLEAENGRRPVPERMLYGVLLLKAVAQCLGDFSAFNGTWSQGAFRPSDRVNLGVAISLRQGGLIAPAIHDADKMTLPKLMAAFRDLVRRARSGGLRSSELSDATITVTSLGEQGVDCVFPAIYPPQVAIVGFGAVAERPWVVGGEVVGRRIITASLAADHRVSDGHLGGRFLASIARRLQQPEQL